MLVKEIEIIVNKIKEFVFEILYVEESFLIDC